MSNNIIVFRDSYYSQGFEEGVEFINKILIKKHNLKISLQFIEEYESDDPEEGEYAHCVVIHPTHELDKILAG